MLKKKGVHRKDKCKKINKYEVLLKKNPDLFIATVAIS
jgi:hypothetical protein